MADGHFPTLISKDRDQNAVGNPIGAELSDGANALHKVVDVASGGSDAGIAALAVRDDALTTLTPADGDYVRLRTDSTGALWVALSGASFPSKTDDSAFAIGSDAVSPMGAMADETAPDSVDEGDVGIPRMTLDRKLLVRIVGASDANRLDIDASGYAKAILQANSGVDIGDVDVTSVIPGTGATNLGKAVDAVAGASDVGVTALFVRDDALTTITPADGDYARGRVDSVGRVWVHPANTEAAPLFVQVVGGVSGTEIHDYDTAASVAGDGTSNHDYTVASTTFLLKSVIGSFSGGGKIEIQTGPVASLATVAVAFVPKEGGTQQLFFDPPIEVPSTSTGTVRVIRTNRQGQAQDVYSTIIGNDIA